ncbi:hypothetical protein DPMN_073205 [Dreissena polymorpha]|uniref:Uncharacterized protein n=1 Tax=Dreissena polymorpha TaxID=45954 RepID=A0A9D4HCQ9_DREPO|nr:hypothetical protein DPMN_073205 [Dreissena polymorpha]
MKLDWDFKLSLIQDIVEVIRYEISEYLNSSLTYHTLRSKELLVEVTPTAFTWLVM